MRDEVVITVERSIGHPIEQVFSRYTDHAGWSDWAGLGRVRLVREGAPHRDAVGAVRAFSLTPGLREEVTRFEAPTRMEYRVVAGPVPMTGHLGEVIFTPDGQGTRVMWRVSFRPTVPGAGWVMRPALQSVFNRILSRLARDLDGRR